MNTFFTDLEEIISKLLKLLEESVKKNCSNKNVGVIYSSGIDSTVIAFIASKYAEVTAYCVGLPGSEDVKYARKHDKPQPFKMEVVEIKETDVELILPHLLKIAETTDPLKVSVGVPMYFAARKACIDGLEVMLSGQGGDELFGGYSRYLKHAVKDDRIKLHQAMKYDIENAYIDNLNRDMRICKAHGIDLRFPYMDPEIIKYVETIPTEYKIREVKDVQEFACTDEIEGKLFIRKYILRKIAQKIGVPEYIINRKKKAAQYGSRSEKTLQFLAKKNNFRKKAEEAGRQDYVKMYLESLYPSS